MQELTKYFNTISEEFRKSKASTESIETLYDLLYNLENKNRTLEETYILAKTFSLLGYTSKALEILDPAINLALKKKKEKLETLKLEL